MTALALFAEAYLWALLTLLALYVAVDVYAALRWKSVPYRDPSAGRRQRELVAEARVLAARPAATPAERRHWETYRRRLAAIERGQAQPSPMLISLRQGLATAKRHAR